MCNVSSPASDEEEIRPRQNLFGWRRLEFKWSWRLVTYFCLHTYPIDKRGWTFSIF